MRSFLRTFFTPVPIRHTRTPGFLAFTAFALLAMSAVLALAVWLALQPQTQSHVRTHDSRFPLIWAIVAAVVLAAQLVWTTTKGYVYCGRFEVVRKVDDRLIYRAYCLLHLLMITGRAMLALQFPRWG